LVKSVDDFDCLIVAEALKIGWFKEYWILPLLILDFKVG
jgi:hypothetical protein